MAIVPKIKALLLASGLLFLCAATLIWMYIGDRGYIQLQGDVPDHIEGLPLGDQTCLQIPCHYVIYPGEYQVTFSKTGYHDITKLVRVHLFETQTITLHFLTKPYLNKLEALSYFSFPLEQTGQAFKDNQQDVLLPFRYILSKTSEIIKVLHVEEVLFSPTGSGALVLTDTEVGTVVSSTYTKTPISPRSFSFSFDTDNRIYYFTPSSLTGKTELRLYDPFLSSTRLVGIFYNVQSPHIYPCYPHVFVNDGDMNYMLSIFDNRKKIVLDDTFINNARWSPSCDAFLFETGQNNVFLYDLTDTSINLSSYIQVHSLRTIDFYHNNNTFLYVSIDGMKGNLLSYDLENKISQVLVSFPINSDFGKINTVDNSIFLLIDNNIYRVDGVILPTSP